MKFNPTNIAFNLFGFPITISHTLWIFLFTFSVGSIILYCTGYETSLIKNVLPLIIVLLSVFIHELGHAFTAKNYGIEVLEIKLSSLIQITRLSRDKMREIDPKELLWISFAGPLVNLFVVVFIISIYSPLVNLIHFLNSIILSLPISNELISFLETLLIQELFRLIPITIIVNLITG